MISRFAVETSYYRPSNNTVKAKAFLPKDGVTSVFMVGHMSHAERIAHGQMHVGDTRKPEPKQVLGYVEVPAAELAIVNLTLALDEPPSHHHNIGAWPADEDAAKAVALQLADAAVFRPR